MVKALVRNKTTSPTYLSRQAANCAAVKRFVVTIGPPGAAVARADQRDAMLEEHVGIRAIRRAAENLPDCCQAFAHGRKSFKPSLIIHRQMIGPPCGSGCGPPYLGGKPSSPRK